MRPANEVLDAIVTLDVDVVTDGTVTHQSDLVTVEEPLEIRLVYGPADHRVVRSVAVTMRTPGDDLALAVGFLYGEGVIRSIEDIAAIDHDEPPDHDEGTRNVVRVELAPTAVFDADVLSRNFYTTSSCGVCGKTSIDAVRVKIPDFPRRDAFAVDHQTLGKLPERLRRQQETFARTGGLHASGAFDTSGQVVAVSEDVGRHNALDKLVGRYLSDGALPLSGLGLVFSGRASFELIQKAAMAGCTFVAAIGPPSSLAVELAAEQQMTLVGFLREHRFNVYAHPHRVLVGA